MRTIRILPSNQVEPFATMIQVDVKPLLAIAAMDLAAAMSPGPAFLLVSRTAANGSREEGLRAAAGTITASVTWAVAAVLGLQVVLARAADAYRIFQLLGGLYLCYVGITVWRGANKATPASGSRPANVSNPFQRGLTIGLSNPKVIVFFGTIFSTAFAEGTPANVKWAAVAVVFLIETFWYTTLALFFGVAPVRAVYQKLKTTLERIFGGILLIFGGRLAYSALKS
jgi:threonine efflux protein